MQTDIPVTQFIHDSQLGDQGANNALFAGSYARLRALARARLRLCPRDTMLGTTSLVHEFYVRFASSGYVPIANRSHFIHFASRVMRYVIVDFVRKRQARRRHGADERVTLDTKIPAAPSQGETEILRVHEALEDLAKFNERLAQVVEMRYFAGLTEPQIAEILSVTERTVRRDWEKARLMLIAALQ
jgi:RNA polymerase sigma factor (TIGR02999 family)